MNTDGGVGAPDGDRLILSALTGLFARWSSREVQQESAHQSDVAVDSTDLRAVYLLGVHGEWVRPSVLADELHLSRPTTSKLLVRLAAGGLIERQDDGMDKRVRLVGLTDRGREIFDRLVATGIRMIQDATAGWEDDEREHFRRTIMRFVAGIQAQPAASPRADETVSDANSGRDK